MARDSLRGNVISNSCTGLCARLRPVGALVSAALVGGCLILLVNSAPAAAKSLKISTPGKPTSLTVIDLDSALAVSWQPPASDGGSPITGYTVTATSKSSSSSTCSTTGATTCTVSDFPVTTQDSVVVQAENSKGFSKKSTKVKTRAGDVPECSYLGLNTDLESCRLAGFDLADAYLQGANLTGASLAATNLGDADLFGATLTLVTSGGINGNPSELPNGWTLTDGYLIGPEANLTSANLDDANLADADLIDAYLSSANLANADLAAADLAGTDLSGTDLTGVSSGGITGTPSDLPPGWIVTDGYLIGPGADLTNANLTNADLASADLTNANLAGADLSGTDLTGVSSGGITGAPSSLPSGWVLTDGYLVGPSANLTDANLTNADLGGANLNGVNLASVNLTGVTSGGITGTPSGLPSGWVVTDGYLVGPSANLTDAELTNANLAGADLSGAN